MTILAVPAAAVGSLRQRRVDDMALRRLSRETQRNYLRDVGRLATFVRRSPDTATVDDLRRFQIAQQEVGLGVPTMNAIVSALRFFFVHTIERPNLARSLVRFIHPRPLPDVLSADELGRLLGATVCLKHLAALSVAYGAGLRVAEVAALKVSYVDSTRMLLRVERGKGGRDRNAMLSVDLLTLLRRWWIEGHRQGVLHREGWLFPGQDWAQSISTRQLHRVAMEAVRSAGIPRRVGPHTLRHSFATHLLVDGACACRWWAVRRPSLAKSASPPTSSCRAASPPAGSPSSMKPRPSGRTAPWSRSRPRAPRRSRPVAAAHVGLLWRGSNAYSRSCTCSCSLDPMQ